MFECWRLTEAVAGSLWRLCGGLGSAAGSLDGSWLAALMGCMLVAGSQYVINKVQVMVKAFFLVAQTHQTSKNLSALQLDSGQGCIVRGLESSSLLALCARFIIDVGGIGAGRDSSWVVFEAWAWSWLSCLQPGWQLAACLDALYAGGGISVVDRPRSGDD